MKTILTQNPTATLVNNDNHEKNNIKDDFGDDNYDNNIDNLPPVVDSNDHFPNICNHPFELLLRSRKSIGYSVLDALK